jgi:hypothetical protein
MIESFVQEWWPQIVALVIVIAWLNRQQTRMEVRIEQLEKKVENLFILWNKHMDRLLDRRDK